MIFAYLSPPRISFLDHIIGSVKLTIRIPSLMKLRVSLNRVEITRLFSNSPLGAGTNDRSSIAYSLIWVWSVIFILVTARTSFTEAIINNLMLLCWLHQSLDLLARYLDFWVVAFVSGWESTGCLKGAQGTAGEPDTCVCSKALSASSECYMSLQMFHTKMWRSLLP